MLLPVFINKTTGHTESQHNQLPFTSVRVSAQLFGGIVNKLNGASGTALHLTVPPSGLFYRP